MGLLNRNGPAAPGAARSASSASRARLDAGRPPGCEPISACQPRRNARVAGVVESIKLVPRPDTMRLEITISDGTGEVSGVWFGHHKIAGLDLGEQVIFQGMLGSPGAGKLEILHPTYQLLGIPAHA